MYEVIRNEDFLEHHGVKGMRWGVVHEDERTNPRNRQQAVLPSSNRSGSRQSVRSGSNGGHSYYSPNTGNSSQYNRNPKENVQAPHSGLDRRQKFVFPKEAKLNGSTPVYTLGINDGKGGVTPVNFDIPESTINGCSSWLDLGNQIFARIRSVAADNDIYMTKEMQNNIFRSLMWCIQDNKSKWDLDKKYKDTSDSWTGSNGAYSSSRRGSSGHNNGHSISSRINHSYSVVMTDGELYHRDTRS